MGGAGGTDVCLRGGADGCVALARAATSMRRRGAHVASPMVGGRVKSSPCLWRANERHILVNALGRTSYSPTQGPPEGFRNPAQSAPESHALGGVLISALSHSARRRAANETLRFGPSHFAPPMAIRRRRLR